MGTSEEKPEKKRIVIGAEEENKKMLVAFAVWLVVTIIIAFILDTFFSGVPLNLNVPVLNVPVTVSMILYYTAILTTAIYIGVVGLKELFIERRFSVEFLMAVAGLGALALDYRFEAATVLFLYCLAEYFEGYIQDRARRTVEKISKVIPEKARLLTDGKETSVDVSQI